MQLADYFGSGSTVMLNISRRRKDVNVAVVFIGSFGLWLSKFIKCHLVFNAPVCSYLPLTECARKVCGCVSSYVCHSPPLCVLSCRYVVGTLLVSLLFQEG